MKYTKLGSTDLNISRICMGCMGFGDAGNGQHTWTVDEEHSRAIIRQGVEAGINFFDTAIGYQSGTSEQYLGRALWDYETPLYDIMEGLNNIVKAGKARHIGISNCYAYQLAKANALAEKEGFAKFVSIQGHYNLIFREEEREMAKLCREDNIAMTPYSALAGGRLSKKVGETSKRLEEDSYAKLKYGATAQQDHAIIARVEELAEKHGVSMTEISLAWLLTKVTSPVVGATKPHHVDGAVKSVDLQLTAEELLYLEEPYIPHRLAGVMAQNTVQSAKEKHVWSTGNQKI